MREEKRDQFLVNMQEEINKEKKYIETVKIKDDLKKIKTVEIGKDTIELKQSYNNTYLLKTSLDNGAEKVIESVRTYNEDVYDYGVRCFNTYRSFLKDIINLCYFDLDLQEKYMDLVYNMVYNTMFNLNNKIIKVDNEYSKKLNDLARQHDETERNIKNQEMIDYMNAPTYVTANYYNDSVFGDTRMYGSAFKIGKPPQASGTNMYNDLFYSDCVADEKKDRINEIFNIIIDDIHEFNEKFMRFIYEKDDRFTSEGNKYLNKDTWLKYVSSTNEKDLDKIVECVNFFDIDIKPDIEDLVVNNSINYKKTDDNYLNIYKLVNDNKDIDVSKKVAESISVIFNKKVDEVKKAEDKRTIADKCLSELDKVSYLDKKDYEIVEKNIKDNIEKFISKKNEEKEQKKKKNTKLAIKIILIILGIALALFLILSFKEFFKEMLIVVLVIYAIFRFFKWIAGV